MGESSNLLAPPFSSSDTAEAPDILGSVLAAAEAATMPQDHTRPQDEPRALIIHASLPCTVAQLLVPTFSGFEGESEAGVGDGDLNEQIYKLIKK